MDMSRFALGVIRELKKQKCYDKYETLLNQITPSVSPATQPFPPPLA